MSPFKSEKQKKYLFKFKPKLAHKWADKYGSETLNGRIKKAKKKK